MTFPIRSYTLASDHQIDFLKGLDRIPLFLLKAAPSCPFDQNFQAADFQVFHRHKFAGSSCGNSAASFFFRLIQSVTEDPVKSYAHDMR